ncbi:hypothetical protein D5086_010318 [Populus alba]|uniref:Uncharacterized protein n=1 Tax=Populus alba TaxID=43335 RepID=A0ACC4CAL7_POPAL
MPASLVRVVFPTTRRRGSSIGRMGHGPQQLRGSGHKLPTSSPYLERFHLPPEGNCPCDWSESVLLGIAETRAQKSDMLEAVPLSLERQKFNPPLRSDLLPLYYKLDNK